MYLYVEMLNIAISALDHVVFNVRNAERSVAFYADALGLEPVRLEDFRGGTAPFPSVRINAHTILDFFPPEYHHAEPNGRNVNHIALSVDAEPDALEAFLQERSIAIVRRMADNFAARGTAHTAFHVVDPDENLVELHTYRPLEWHPRRGREPLGTFLWLRRIVDKARAHQAGTIGEYIYPCPIDLGVMERWGITPEQFQGAIGGAAGDDAILRWAESAIAPERRDAANSWLCVEKIENLDRQDREEWVFP